LLTIALWIAGVADWLPAGMDDQWSALSLKVALVVLAASFVLRVISPVTKQVSRARCGVCGRPIARGQVYCLDHLQETVNAYRDRAHDANLSRRR
jgi:predicted nucleic acid-binding Zn ribbon protein